MQNILLTLAVIVSLCSLTQVAARFSSSSSSSSICSTRHVATLNINGCTVFIGERAMSGKSELWIEPLFCVTNVSSVLNANGLAVNSVMQSFEPQKYTEGIAVPVQITDASFVEAIRKQLAKSYASAATEIEEMNIQFIPVMSVRAKANARISRYLSGDFMWIMGKQVGHVLVTEKNGKNNFANLLLRDQFHLLKEFSVTAISALPECQHPIIREYPISVANSSIDIRHLQRTKRTREITCLLKLIKVFEHKNCTAVLYELLTNPGHFVLEPLLCYTGFMTSLHDVTAEAKKMKKLLRLKLYDAELLHFVKEQISDLKPVSVTFAQLQDVNVTVVGDGVAFAVDSVSVSSDRNYAEVVVSPNVISGRHTAEQLNHLWSRLKWSLTSSVFDAELSAQKLCNFKSLRDSFGNPARIEANSRRSSLFPYSEFVGPKSEWLGSGKSICMYDFMSDSIFNSGKGFYWFNFPRNALYSEWKYGVLDSYYRNRWIGLQPLHKLTAGNNSPYALVLRSKDGAKQAVWHPVHFASESDNYKMTIGNMRRDLSAEGVEDILPLLNGTEFKCWSGVADCPERMKCPVDSIEHSWFFKGCNASSSSSRNYFRRPEFSESVSSSRDNKFTNICIERLID